MRRELAVNIIAPLIAAQEAIKGFKKLPSSVSKTFIVTGNMLNVSAKPDSMTYGMGKSALAHMIRVAAVGYAGQGFKWVPNSHAQVPQLTTNRFYYADQRHADGGPSFPVDGRASGEMYVELAGMAEQGPWDYTFVPGKGYTSFAKLALDVLPSDIEMAAKAGIQSK